MSIDLSRRHFLTRAGMGFGALAASALLSAQKASGGTAKSVISLFMHGGPSHLDTFDPKPLLNKMNGQLVPESFGDVRLQFSTFKERPILGSSRKFTRYGDVEISDLFPHLAKHSAKLAVVRSMNHDGFTHTAALNWLNNGWPRIGRPSVGSWVVYGMGAEAQNLPAFVVMLEGGIKSGPPVYGSGFLPATFQATTLRSSGTPILYASRAEGTSERAQRDMLDTLQWFNQSHQSSRNDDTDLSARIKAYELAFKMQMAVPELADLSKETEATKALYGMDNATTAEFGTRCLMARRLVERGVRFVQLWSGTSTGEGDWDGHKGCEKNHETQAAKTDKGVAGLLEDLSRRGLLDETLVIWGGEFGRTPTSDGSANGGGDNFGRDHNPYGFSVWMAGGGIQGGQVIGATDEIGLRAVQDPVHVHDLHASILAMLGLDHLKLTFPFQGRDFRLTDVHGSTALAAKLRRK